MMKLLPWYFAVSAPWIAIGVLAFQSAITMGGLR